MIFVELKSASEQIQEITKWLEQNFAQGSYEISYNSRNKTLTVAFKSVDDAINYSNHWLSA